MWGGVGWVVDAAARMFGHLYQVLCLHLAMYFKSQQHDGTRYAPIHTNKHTPVHTTPGAEKISTVQEAADLIANQISNA